MKKLNRFCPALLASCLFLACSDDDMTTTNSNVDIDQALKEWISQWDSENTTYTYTNGTDSLVSLTLTNVSQFYADCQIGGMTVQCEYESRIIEFPEGSSPENGVMAVTVLLIAESDIRIMPTRGGIVVSAARLDAATGEVRTEKPDNFEVSYNANFPYNGGTTEAISFVTNSTEDLANGGVIPPKSMTLAKGAGIVEWEDYFGNTWVLDN